MASATSHRLAAGLRRRARDAVQALGVPLLYLAMRLVRLYRPTFHQTSPWLYRIADSLGVFPVLDHYHEPLVVPRSLRREPRSLPGLELRTDDQVALLSELRYGSELEDGIREWSSDPSLRPTFDNLAFGPGDAEILYAVIRHRRPRRVVEIGSGHSTRFAKLALDHNRAGGTAGEHICIEPFESPWLERLGDVRVVRRPVEELGAEFFTKMSENDILFIDSSHVVRPGGDVLYLLHEVLPHLAPGVLIHIHDVFTPRDYPDEWIRRRWFWTEQYLLEALLVDNDRYAVYLALSHLFHDRSAELFAACPVLAVQREKEPGSFWMSVVR